MYFFPFSLPMTSLSKFAICLSDQHLQHSTLMGHITSIIDQTLLSIHDVRSVTKPTVTLTYQKPVMFSLFTLCGHVFSEFSRLS